MAFQEPFHIAGGPMNQVEVQIIRAQFIDGSLKILFLPVRTPCRPSTFLR